MKERYGPIVKERYGPVEQHGIAVHRFSQEEEGWRSACGQIAYPASQLYKPGTPLDAIKRRRCGNCFRRWRDMGNS